MYYVWIYEKGAKEFGPYHSCFTLISKVWAEFEHPILRRSFRRVQRLYAINSHFFFFNIAF